MEIVLNKYSKTKKTFLTIGLLAFPFVLSLQLPLNIKSIAFIVFLVTLFFNISPNNIDIKKTFTNRIVVLFMTLYLLDPVLSVIRGDGFYVRDLRISFLIAPALFLASKDLLKSFKNKILIAFAAGVFGYIVFSVGYLIYFFNIEANYEIFTIGYYLKYITYHYMPFAIHHTYMGIYICFAVYVVIFNCEIKNISKAILCVVLFLSIFLIASKLSVIFFFIIICFYLFRNFNLSFIKLLVAIITFLLIIASITLYLFIETDLFRTLDDSINQRKNLFFCSLQGIYSNITIGIGSNNVKDFIEQCDSNLGLLDTHNLFFQEFLSNGVFGIVTLIGILYVFSKTFFKAKSLSGIILITMVIFFGLIEHVLNLQNGVLFFIYFLLLFYSITDLKLKTYDG